jgi:FdhD protein
LELILEMADNILQKVDMLRVNGGCKAVSENIIKETPLTINIDGRPYATAMIMATMEKEYVVGHLYAQGVIRSAYGIESIDIKNNIANVTLARGARKPAFTGVHSQFTVTKEDIFECVKAILKSPVFADTEAVHSAGLFYKGKEKIGIAEDLGRHNALDKVIGCGVLQYIDFRRTLATSTGRIPTEMVFKCTQAKIPIIATKGVPTSLAIDIAEKSGITIAGLVRGETMIVYTHPERVV